jgi:hypothetical protein
MLMLKCCMLHVFEAYLARGGLTGGAGRRSSQVSNCAGAPNVLDPVKQKCGHGFLVRRQKNCCSSQQLRRCCLNHSKSGESGGSGVASRFSSLPRLPAAAPRPHLRDSPPSPCNSPAPPATSSPHYHSRPRLCIPPSPPLLASSIPPLIYSPLSTSSAHCPPPAPLCTPPSPHTETEPVTGDPKVVTSHR